ncbi:MAG: glycerol kinase GlpK [Gammaproteobacteria bacterium]|nr:glycerol kinase GlpK [Gammaproteobacteria bacterium]
MHNTPLILSIDQGTTSSRAIVFNASGESVAMAQYSFEQHYPANGWVEHNPEDIWQTTIRACAEVLSQSKSLGNVIAAGIANQRETTLVWNRRTGKPVYNAIVWQDRRTSEQCTKHQEAQKTKPSLDSAIKTTGLRFDPYFSATKISWILDNVEGAREQAEAGELAFGTVDTFLIWRFTKGAQHLTDATNASRTLLFDIREQKWNPQLLSYFDIPASLLPEVRNSAADYGHIHESVLNLEIPICGVAGDQQAALFGQSCFDPGMAKSTYGTGCFMILNTGKEPIESTHNLLTTIGYQLDSKPTYALEGSIFNAGSTIQWLRDQLGLIQHTNEIESHLDSQQTNEGVYIVPAFTGLGAPYWTPNARGLINGLTRDTTPAHLFRAAIESVCYQTHDLIEAMSNDSGTLLTNLRVDGGMTVNNHLLQFLSNLLDVEVTRPKITETTALGVFFLAGLSIGLFDSLETLKSKYRSDITFEPCMGDEERIKNLQGWKHAVTQCLA